MKHTIDPDRAYYLQNPNLRSAARPTTPEGIPREQYNLLPLEHRTHTQVSGVTRGIGADPAGIDGFFVTKEEELPEYTPEELFDIWCWKNEHYR